MGVQINTAARRASIRQEAEAAAARIDLLAERLFEGIGSLTPAQYDRLLDDYRAQLVRLDRLERLLHPRQSDYGERNKINY